MRQTIVNWLVRNPRIGALCGATPDECNEAATRLRAHAADLRASARAASRGRATDFNDDEGWDHIADQENDADTAEQDAALLVTVPVLPRVSKLVIRWYAHGDAPVGLTRRILQRGGLSQSQAGKLMGVAREWEQNQCTCPDWATFGENGEESMSDQGRREAVQELLPDEATRNELCQWASENRPDLLEWIDAVLAGEAPPCEDDE